MIKLKQFLLIGLILIFAFSLVAHGQTPVSGGIYSNTTWTLANSPYIVTGNVVVFPGNTLTIEPGVIVKFEDNFGLEIRQAKLIALGTKNDSISFTSNSSIPSPGIYEGINLNLGYMVSEFKYCNFEYASKGLYKGIWDSILVTNSRFSHNETGLQSVSLMNLIVDSCIIDSNTVVGLSANGAVKVSNCQFLGNGDGLIADGGAVRKCVFYYNDYGLKPNNIWIDSCEITNNINGIDGGRNIITRCNISWNSNFGMYSCYMDSVSECIISMNRIGIQMFGDSRILNNKIEFNSKAGIEAQFSTLGQIRDNYILHNGIGIMGDANNFQIVRNSIQENDTGILLTDITAYISCNTICNYNIDLAYKSDLNYSISPNYWCSMDSSTIETMIYDGYDNAAFGLVSIISLDTSDCNLMMMDVSEIEAINNDFEVFPNPVVDHVNFALKDNTGIREIRIFNIFGQMIRSIVFPSFGTNINVSDISSGIYVIEVSTLHGTFRKKFIKV